MQQKLLGYKKIKEDILNSFTNRKLHHAIILSGIEGIGKYSFAQEVAQKITGSNISIDNNPDILIIKKGLNSKGDPRKDIVVDEVRKINDFVELSSSLSEFRCIIIDGVDYLNKNAANAILKNLEEPPSNVFFFLVSHNENLILDTVKSRCSFVRIKPPAFQDFVDILSSNIVDIEDKELRLLFDVSGGSISSANDLHDSNFLDGYKNILLLKVNTDINLSQSELIDSFVKHDKGMFVFENIIFLLLSRVVKLSSGVIMDEFFGNELQLLSKYSNKNTIDSVFIKKDKIVNLLLKVNNLNLDKKQSLINIFNIL
jgi:DNA polymerase-3 subunit delta'